MLANFPIFGGYNDRSDIAFNSEDLVNLFMIADPAGKKRYAFIGTPGLSKALTIREGTDAVRNLYTYVSNMYGVFGSSVYRFNQPLVQDYIGELNTTKGYVSIAANNAAQIIFTDGTAGYLYSSQSGNFTEITSSGFPTKPTNVVFLDGYFITPEANSTTFQISGLNDGSAWDPLDSAQIIAYPGNNVGVGVVNRRLYFFKTDSCEVWYNAGFSDFPFRRDNNMLFNFGCLTANSIQSDFGYLFWLARDRNGVGSVMMTTGQEPVKISNEAIDNLIAGFTNPSDMTAWIYKDEGYIFYVMNFQTDDETIVYNLTLNNWHRMEMQQTLQRQNVPYSGMTRHLGNCHAYFNGKHYIGSYKALTLYEMSRNFSSNAGEPIKRERICPHFFDPDNYRMIQVNGIQIDMRMGIGLTNGEQRIDLWGVSGGDNVIDSDGNNLAFASENIEGFDPAIYLSISRDGGQTYGNRRGVGIGKLGQRQARAKFWRLGQARDFVAKFTFYDTILPVVILGASIDFEVLSK